MSDIDPLIGPLTTLEKCSHVFHETRVGWPEDELCPMCTAQRLSIGNVPQPVHTLPLVPGLDRAEIHAEQINAEPATSLLNSRGNDTIGNLVPRRPRVHGSRHHPRRRRRVGARQRQQQRKQQQTEAATSETTVTTVTTTATASATTS